MTREYTVIFEDSNSIDIKEVKTIFLPSILSSILIFFSKVITLKIWCVFLFSICLEIIHIHLFKIKIASDYTACRRRQWHHTPVLLPGKSHGWRSLVGCSPWVAKSRARLSDFTFTFHFHALEKEMTTRSSVLAWRIPGTEEPSGLPSMGSHRVGHNWCDLAVVAAADLTLPLEVWSTHQQLQPHQEAY